MSTRKRQVFSAEFKREAVVLLGKGDKDVQAALKIRTAIARMEYGNFSNAKSVGQGVSEYKLDFGPGYRIYFGKDGHSLVILLGGGTKQRQSRDKEATKQL